MSWSKIVRSRRWWPGVGPAAAGSNPGTASQRSDREEGSHTDLVARQTLVSDLSREFNTMIFQLRPAPWIQSETIDPSSYLPVVDNVSFENFHADGGGIVTCINVATTGS